MVLHAHEVVVHAAHGIEEPPEERAAAGLHVEILLCIAQLQDHHTAGVRRDPLPEGVQEGEGGAVAVVVAHAGIHHAHGGFARQARDRGDVRERCVHAQRTCELQAIGPMGGEEAAELDGFGLAHAVQSRCWRDRREVRHGLCGDDHTTTIVDRNGAYHQQRCACLALGQGQVAHAQIQHVARVFVQAAFEGFGAIEGIGEVAIVYTPVPNEHVVGDEAENDRIEHVGAHLVKQRGIESCGCSVRIIGQCQLLEVGGTDQPARRSSEQHGAVHQRAAQEAIGDAHAVERPEQ